MKKILAIPGSIHTKSYNKMVCRYLQSLSNSEASIEVFEIDAIPFFSEDLESDLPAEVKSLISKINESDAVIFSTPEYNNMVPGVLKNTCEWLSRGYSASAVKDKPVAIMGVSTGGFGTVRAQNQLLLLLSILGFRTSASLRLPISNAQDKFDSTGTITDTETQQKIKDTLTKLINIDKV